MRIYLHIFFLLSTTGAFATIHPVLPNSDSHDFHLSKCQIEYSESTQALQIMMHIYLDDLEEALRQRGKDKLFLCTDKEDPNAEQYLYEYLQSCFKMNLNGKSVSYDFIGKEQSEDLAATWCYLEVTEVTEVNSLEVSNNLLMEIFDDQKNIIHIKGPQKKQGYFLLHKGQEKDRVSF